MSQLVEARPPRLFLNEQPTVSGFAVDSFAATTGCATLSPSVVGAEMPTAAKPSIAAKKNRKVRIVDAGSSVS